VPRFGREMVPQRGDKGKLRGYRSCDFEDDLESRVFWLGFVLGDRYVSRAVDSLHSSLGIS
jgi:hypothetical protein